MKITSLMLSLPILMACATLAPAQSSDVKQSSTDSAKLDALAAQVKQLADSIKSAEWETRLKKLESEIQNLKDASVRMETLIKSDEARKSYYQAPVTTAKPVVPQPTATLRLVNTTALQILRGELDLAILTGGETSVTDYFRWTTADALAKKFLPIVKKATAKVGLAERYNAIAGQGAQLGLVDASQASIEQYVTRKSLDGLYTIIAEEEKAIRQDPVGAASSIVQKLFGAIK